MKNATTNTTNTNNTTNTTEKTQRIWNAIRPAIVLAHADNNGAAITKSRAHDAHVTDQQLKTWIAYCNDLFKVVWAYVGAKKNRDYGQLDITDDDLSKLRQDIFPAWKKILACGKDADPDAVEECLRVRPTDIEDLVKFAWDFTKSDNGTIAVQNTEKKFRKLIETELGCRIASNQILPKEEHETLATYRSACAKIEKISDQVKEYKERIKALKGVMTKETSEDLKKYINAQVKEIEKSIKTAEDRKDKAIEKRDKVKETALTIMEKIRKIEGKK